MLLGTLRGAPANSENNKDNLVPFFSYLFADSKHSAFLPVFWLQNHPNKKYIHKKTYQMRAIFSGIPIFSEISCISFPSQIADDTNRSTHVQLKKHCTNLHMRRDEENIWEMQLHN